MYANYENIELERFIGAGEDQAMVEADAAINGVGRNIVRVLSCEARVLPGGVETQIGRIEMDGTIIFDVLYTIGEDTRVMSMRLKSGYSYPIEISSAQPGMQARPWTIVEEADARAENGRMRAVAAIRLGAEVYDKSPKETIVNLLDNPAIQEQSMAAKYSGLLGKNSVEAAVTEEYDLPAIMEILDTVHSRAVANVKSVSGGEGRALVSGDVSIECYHTSELENKALVITKNIIPFEQIVEMPGIYGEEMIAAARVTDVSAQSDEADDSGRILRVQIRLQIDVYAYNIYECEWLGDAYTTNGQELELQHEDVLYNTDLCRMDSRDMQKWNVLTPDGARQIKTVLAVFTQPAIGSIENANKNTSVVQGVVNITVIYLASGEDQPTSFSTQAQFTMALDKSLPEGIWPELTIEDCEASPVGDSVEIKGIMRAQAIYSNKQSSRIITSAEVSGDQFMRGSIIVYRIQQGDTLWKLAKRFKVAQDVMMRQNESVSDLKPGQSVVVYNQGVMA